MNWNAKDEKRGREWPILKKSKKNPKTSDIKKLCKLTAHSSVFELNPLIRGPSRLPLYRHHHHHRPRLKRLHSVETRNLFSEIRLRCNILRRPMRIKNKSIFLFRVSFWEREREIDRQIIQTFFNLKQMLFSLISSFVGVSCIKKGVGREAPFIFFTKDKSENVKPGFKLNLTQSTTTSNLSWHMTLDFVASYSHI